MPFMADGGHPVSIHGWTISSWAKLPLSISDRIPMHV